MVPAQPQLGKEAAPIVDVVILYFAGAGEDVELPFDHPGQFQWKEPTILRPGVKGDQPLIIREPTTAIVMPDITGTLTDFQTLAAEHCISLVRINIQEFIDEIGKRGRLLSGDVTGADEVWAPLESSVMEGYRRDRIALMTLSLFLYGNTELAFIFIFCISKYSSVTNRKTMKLIWEKKFNSHTH